MTWGAIALLAVAVVAGTWDLRRGRIPNAVTYSAAAAGLLISAIESGAAGLAAGVLGAGAALAVGLPLFLWGGMGGGDVKLFAAVGALAGPYGLVQVFVASLALGAAAAVAMLVWRGELLRTLWSVAVFFATALTPRVRIVAPLAGPRLRFGVCIALAGAGLALFGRP